MSLFKDKPTPRVRAVFDITDGSIGAAIVNIDADTPKVVWSHRQTIPVNRHADTDHLHRSMRDTLQAVTRRLHKQGLAVVRKQNLDDKIAHVVCVLDTPWHVDGTVSSRLSKQKPFFVNKRSVRAAQRAAHDRFIEENKLSRSKQRSKQDLHHVHQQIISIYSEGSRLNSIPRNPITNLQVFMYISKLKSDVRESIQKTFQMISHPEKIDFYSATDVMSRVLANKFTHPRDFLVIRPHRTHTRVLLVKDGKLADTQMHDLGEDFVIRAIGNALDRSTDEVQSRLRLHRKGKQLQDSTQEIDVALEEIGKHWNQLLREKINSMTTGSPPQHAYLFLPQSDTSHAFEKFYAATQKRHPKLSTHVAGDHLFSRHFNDLHKPDYCTAIAILGTERY